MKGEREGAVEVKEEETEGGELRGEKKKGKDKSESEKRG